MYWWLNWLVVELRWTELMGGGLVLIDRTGGGTCFIALHP